MEQFVLDHIVAFDCATYAILTLYAFLFVSWFFDTKLWEYFTDLPEELQIITVILGLLFSGWYAGCAVFGWEYRVVPHIIGSICMGIVFLIVGGYFLVGGICVLREKILSKRRNYRY